MTYYIPAAGFTCNATSIDRYCFNLTNPTFTRAYCLIATTPTTYTIKNEAPTISGVSITPGSPSEFDTLTANYNLTYTDGYGDCTNFKWFNNNVEIVNQTASTLPPTAFAAYDEIIVQVTPNDCNGDGTPLNSTLIRIRKTVSSGDTGGGGGGGGAIPSVDVGEEKETCNIEITPKVVYLGLESELVKVIVKNKDDVSYDPDFKIKDVQGNTSKYFDITNALDTILPGKESSFGIKYNPTDTLTAGKTLITLTSDNCKNINITVYSKSIEKDKTVIEELFSDDMTVLGFFQDNLFRPDTEIRRTLPIVSIGMWSFLLLMILLGIMFNSILIAFQNGNIGTGIAWIIFVLIVTSIITVFTVVGIRMLQSYIPILM